MSSILEKRESVGTCLSMGELGTGWLIDKYL